MLWGWTRRAKVISDKPKTIKKGGERHTKKKQITFCVH